MMQRILSCAIVVAAMAVAPAPAVAEPTAATSIETLVADIVAHNYERQFYDRELAAAKTVRRAAGRLPDPDLTTEFGEKNTTSPDGSHFGAGPAYSVAILQPLEFNGRIALRKAIADREIELAELGYRQFVATLAARARTLAYTLFNAAEKADAAREVDRRVTAVAQVMVQRDIAGPSPLIEARVLEAGAITARRQAEVAEQEYNSTLHELNQLRGTPFAAHVRLIKPGLSFPPLPATELLVERARTDNFDIRSLQAQLAQQGLNVSLARRSRIGSVSVGPYYRNERAGTTDRYAGVAVKVPLPLWNAQAGAVATQEARVAQAESALLAQTRTIEREVFDQASIYRERGASLARLGSDTIPRFHDMADLAERSYRLGAVTVTLYLDAQRQYLDALTAILDTRRDAEAARLQVDLLTGQNGDAGE